MSFDETKPVGFVTLGMFIIDEFSFSDENGIPTGRTVDAQEWLVFTIYIGGGGTYAAIGARIWLPAEAIGMVVDRGYDFPDSIRKQLLAYGSDMWMFRNQPGSKTTRALNSYVGEHRNFEYLTPRIRITPRDLIGTRIAKPKILHFICSPSRASAIMAEVGEIADWYPTTIYEPIPDRCVPEELPALIEVLPSISILSPNAEEALSLLSRALPPTRASIEEAASCFLDYGIGDNGSGHVIIRSGEMGAYVKSRERKGIWIEAYWKGEHEARIVDVTGAGNSFLGGLAAGLLLSPDVFDATFYASVSASFTIEQQGLPTVSGAEAEHPLWNGDFPLRRLQILKARHGEL
ncbi:Uncharacterized protein C16C9.01c [Hypsizygus marmoreus]|uniref:Uncharacterized protein C16C9.01c n=1 Tax=Hypsizygus marmoreus TaxID=39966 RepID=A0A369JN62_HYPMA|nr:Uncharacterized protein C16C9.01c [Hypsizygus marmoreus]